MKNHDQGAESKRTHMFGKNIPPPRSVSILLEAVRSRLNLLKGLYVTELPGFVLGDAPVPVDFFLIEDLGRPDAVHTIDKSADALGGLVLHLLQRTSDARLHPRHALVHVGWHPGPFKSVFATGFRRRTGFLSRTRSSSRSASSFRDHTSAGIRLYRYVHLYALTSHGDVCFLDHHLVSGCNYFDRIAPFRETFEIDLAVFQLAGGNGHASDGVQGDHPAVVDRSIGSVNIHKYRGGVLPHQRAGRQQ